MLRREDSLFDGIPREGAFISKDIYPKLILAPLRCDQSRVNFRYLPLSSSAEARRRGVMGSKKFHRRAAILGRSFWSLAQLGSLRVRMQTNVSAVLSLTTVSCRVTTIPSSRHGGVSNVAQWASRCLLRLPMPAWVTVPSTTPPNSDKQHRRFRARSIRGESDP
jgi:hypothetical protein